MAVEIEPQVLETPEISYSTSRINAYELKDGGRYAVAPFMSRGMAKAAVRCITGFYGKENPDIRVWFENADPGAITRVRAQGSADKVGTALKMLRIFIRYDELLTCGNYAGAQ